MPDTKVASSRATCCGKPAGSCRSSNAAQRAFKITGLTWIVERSFAWLGRNRRLSKDYEYSVQTSETLIDIAATRLMLKRLAPI
jgi:transposase